MNEINFLFSLYLGIGCEFNGYQLDHSQTFEQDACTTCTCLQGRVECSTTTCPVLTCPSQTTPDGECCPQCTGQGGCVYEDMSFNSGDFFTPMANPCLRCSCLVSSSLYERLTVSSVKELMKTSLSNCVEFIEDQQDEASWFKVLTRTYTPLIRIARV